MQKTVIFDMDGVITDSEPFHCEAWISTYKEIGIEIDQNYYFTRICGQHGKVSTSMVLNEFNKEADKDALIRRKEEIVSEKVNGNIVAFPGVVELIKRLQYYNYKLGLASSTSFMGVDAILSNVNIKDAFSTIHAGEAVELGKPHPGIYLKTAKMLHADPNNCVVFEDTCSGVLSAKRAGMKVVGILNGRNNREQLEYADVIVEGFNEISLELIERL